MIWESTWIMTAIDVAVLIATVVLMWGAVRYRDLIVRAKATTAAFLVLVSLPFLVVLHVADLYLLWVMPYLATPERAEAAVARLNIHWAWLVHFGAFVLVISGGVLAAQRIFALVRDADALVLERDAELAARQAMVAELGESRNKLRNAQRMARLGSWRWHLDTGQWTASPELIRILAIPASEEPFDPDTFRAMLAPPELERLDHAIERALSGERRFELQLELLPAYGRARIVRTVGEILWQEDGRASSVIGMTQDVTESALAAEQLGRMNEQLEQRVRDRTAQLESFALTVSHDLKAPLRVIQGFVDAAIDDCQEQLDARGVAYLNRIKGAAARLHLLVDRLLAYSRLGHVDVEPMPVDLDELIPRLAREVEMDAEGRGGDVVIERPLSKVMGQRDILTQVVGNLLSNAVKFVGEETPPSVRVWTEDGGDQVRIWVEDNGIGLRPSDQERIFNVFERLHGEEVFPGSGMGLAIVQRGVKRMDGRVGVESLTGGGSRFWVELPRAG